MNEKIKSERSLSQLGLPPMELAESNHSENNNSRLKRCLNPLLHKLLAIMVILLVTMGSYIILLSILQGFDNDRTPEIIIIEASPDTPNITLVQKNIEIHFNYKNKTPLTELNRQKRDVKETTSTDSEKIKLFGVNLNDEAMQKAREVILNHNSPCNNGNQEELCKSLIAEIKAFNKRSQNSKNHIENDINDGAYKITSKDTENIVANIENISTSTEKAKRETNVLDDLEVLKPTPNLPFEARDSYGYAPEHALVPALPYPAAATAPQLADTCLLARLLKQNHPSGFYDIGDFPPPPHITHPLPYSRFAPPPPLPSHYFQTRETISQRPEIHPQDVEIFLNLLKPQHTSRSSNSTNRETECIAGSISCSNGEGCISENQWCDGNVDCSDVSDESSCSCKSRVDKSRLCDGYFDCPFGEDEMGCYDCGEAMFSCQDIDVNSQSTCFSKEQRCNNVADCPNHRDEMDCTMLSPSLHKSALFAVSNTEGFLHRNFKGDWNAVCKNPYMWAHDACRRETGLIIRPPFIQVVPIDPTLKINYVNTGHGGLIHMSNTCFNSSAIYVTCPDLLCGTRIMSNAQILKEDDEAEKHLFGRNKRFLYPGNPYPLFFYNNRFKRDTADSMNKMIENQMSSFEREDKSDTDKSRNKRTQSRVVGGRPSQPTSWPWMVAMYRNGMFHCGGVVLTQSWVMSAAHCVTKFWEHYYEIQVGMLRRFSFSPQEQNHRVTHVIVNQFYNQADMKNDLSLLKVKPYIQFSRWVRPICLPGPETAGQEWLWGPPAGTMCTAVGWGATVEHGPDPDHMREVEVPIWDHCKHREDKAGKEICAGLAEGGKDACQGDSGGPLLCKNPLNPQQWYMAGIVSHGDGCARKGEPGVYTRVSLFIKWIRFHIFSDSLPSLQPKQECPGFRCISGIAKCLPNKRMCDKIIDCLGGEDEINCNTMRSRHQLSNLFLSTPLENNMDPLNVLPITKEAEPESKVTEKTSREADNNDSMISTISTESKEADQMNTGPKTENTKTDSVTTQVEADIKTTSTSSRVSENSEREFVNQKSDSKSSEEESHEEDHVTEDPLRTITSEETMRTNRGDLEDTFAVSVSKGTLESRSSVKENKEADIQEKDWADLTPDQIIGSTTTTTIIPITSKTTDKRTSTTENSVENKELVETTNFVEHTPNNSDISTLVNDDSTEAESKHLFIDLPESESSPVLHTNIDSHTESISMKDHTVTLSRNESNSKILPILEDNTIIEKIKDIVHSHLVPAKIKKENHIHREFECRHIHQKIPHHLRCDRKADCEDGTDELGCNCIDYVSRFDRHLICDGIFDCADGQDEIECFGCAEDHFLCKRSQQCLPKKFLCDGRLHCPHGEDELECYALTNGQSIIIGFDGKPKVGLQGFLTKKHFDDWHVVCDENLSTEQQEAVAAHICHYLGFSSANRYLVKHINIKEEDILRINSEEDTRNRREVSEGIPVHFAFRKAEEDTARHIVIKEPEFLKEHCVPNVTKTCMSLYVYCDHMLYTDNFDQPNEIIFNREADLKTHMWPWVAKVFVDGDYRCTGVLIDLSWTLVSHSCLWDALLNHHHITVILGSHRTLNSTRGMYEQIYEIDAKKDLYHSKTVLLHLKEPAQYSDKVKPMVLPTSSVQDSKAAICLALGQDENNTTVGVFLEESNENCDLHSRCFIRKQKENLCAPGMTSRRHWAGIISCHSERGWFPAASFVDSRGECGVGDRIIASEIGSLRHEIKQSIGRSVSSSDSKEINAAVAICEGTRCGRGRCVKMAQVCDGVPDCEDQKDELENVCQMKTNICSKEPFQRGCDCSSGQLKCHNGKCVAKELFRDGHDDCGDGTDEPSQTSCSHYLARVAPSRLCDGVLHCKDRSDEDPMFCKCFAKKNFKCTKGPQDVDMCVASDVVCDGVKDCPNGEDERTCMALSSPEGSTYGIGQVIVRSHGVWHVKCYATQNHTKSELEAICKQLGFISGHAQQLKPPSFLSQPNNNVILDSFSEVKLNNNTSIDIRNTDKPLATPIVDDTFKNCYPVYIECL